MMISETKILDLISFVLLVAAGLVAIPLIALWLERKKKHLH